MLIGFLRENPLLGQLGSRHNAQQISRPLPRRFRIPHRDPVAESQRLLAVHGIGIGPGDADRRTEVRNPGPVPDQIQARVGNGIIVLRVQLRPGGTAFQGFRVDQMGGNGLPHMGGPDKSRGLFQGQILAVDILRPVVTDFLFPQHVVFCHPLHGDGRVDIMLHLVPVILFSLMLGKKRNKNQ